jgi:hypothetical protein
MKDIDDYTNNLEPKLNFDEELKFPKPYPPKSLLPKIELYLPIFPDLPRYDDPISFFIAVLNFSNERRNIFQSFLFCSSKKN